MKEKKHVMNFKKSPWFLVLLCWGFLLIPLTPTPLWGTKSKSMAIKSEDWNSQAKFNNTFINHLQNLQLSPKTQKIISLNKSNEESSSQSSNSSVSSVIWDIYKDGDEIIVATGSDGNLYFFDKNHRLKKTLNLSAKEITAITKDTQGNLYLGSGPEGKIFKVDNKYNWEEWFNTGEQFVWDLQIVKKELWATTGGEAGKVFKIPLSFKDSKKETPSLEPLLTFDEPNILKIKFQGDSFWVNTSSSGKLYKISPNLSMEVIFDAGKKDIADFTFVDDNIYLLTAGQEEISSPNSDVPDEVVMDGNEGTPPSPEQSFTPPPDGLESPSSFSAPFNNYLVKIDKDYQISFIYHFEKKSPVQLIYKEKEQKLLIGLLENSEIYQVSLKNLTQVEKIFFKESANLSSFFFSQDKLFFAVANLGEIYQMDSDFVKEGTYESKIFDFKETAKWGRVVYQNYSENSAVKISSRVGNTQTPDKYWSEWQEVKEKIINRPARFLQLSIELQSKNGISPNISEVKVFYGSQNQPHRITSLKIFKQNNLMIIPEDVNTAGEGLLHTYDINKSLNTTFSTTDKNLAPSIVGQSPIELPFNQVGKKNFILTWDVENQDKDLLVYKIYYRQKKSQQSKLSAWKLFRDSYLNDHILLDGYKFIDGVYQFKLVAEDNLNNPAEESYSHEALSSYQIFDNRPPQIDSLKIQKDSISFKAMDELSFIESVKYTDDKQTVYKISPKDGIYDGLVEEFVLENSSPEVVLIIKDNSENILYYSIER